MNERPSYAASEARLNFIQKARDLLTNMLGSNFSAKSVDFDGFVDEFLRQYLKNDELLTVNQIDKIFGLDPATLSDNKAARYYQDRKYVMPRLVLRMREKGEAVHTLVTRDLVEGLANRIVKKSIDEGLSTVTVLEVGAGNGRLAHCLNKSLQQATLKGVEIKYIPIDIEPHSVHAEVQGMSDIEAIAKYNPEFVIMSYMPQGVDLTINWRNGSNLREYILIGPTESTMQGTADTWGEADLEGPPNFEKDGFIRNNLAIPAVGFYYKEDKVVAFTKTSPVNDIIIGAHKNALNPQAKT